MNVKQELKYGFWMAFALFIWWIFEYLLGLQTPNLLAGVYSSLISNGLIALVGMFIVMLHTKKVVPIEELRYGTLALSGGISLVSSAILLIPLSSIFYHFINQELANLAVQITIDNLAEGTEPNTITHKIEQTRAAFSPGSMGMKNFSNLVTIGFFFLLIEAFIVLKLPLGVSN